MGLVVCRCQNLLLSVLGSYLGDSNGHVAISAVWRTHKRDSCCFDSALRMVQIASVGYRAHPWSPAAAFLYTGSDAVAAGELTRSMFTTPAPTADEIAEAQAWLQEGSEQVCGGKPIVWVGRRSRRRSRTQELLWSSRGVCCWPRAVA